MKSPAEWFTEQAGEDLEMFTDEERRVAMAYIAGIQADARADRDELIQRMRGCLIAFVHLHREGYEPVNTIPAAEALIRESKPA